jgi:hypothetical protein
VFQRIAYSPGHFPHFEPDMQSRRLIEMFRELR